MLKQKIKVSEDEKLFTVDFNNGEFSLRLEKPHPSTADEAIECAMPIYENWKITHKE